MFSKETQFQETDIGRIPQEWQVTTLSNVAEIRGNRRISNFKQIAFIPMALVPDSHLFAKYEMREKEQVKSYTYCEAGDLLLAKITPSLENGKQGIVPSDISEGVALATTEVFPIRSKGIDTLFLFYVLKFSKFRNKIISSMIGTTGRQRASKEGVERLKVPLPPSYEQRGIVEVLSCVDLAIQKTDEVIAKTERLKKGLMQKLLTEGIGQKEFKETGIGKTPRHWEITKIKSIALDKKGAIKIGPFGSQLKKNELAPEGIKVYGQENVMKNDFALGNRYLTVEKFQTLKGFELYPKDVLITMMGSIGYSTPFPDNVERGIMDSHLIRIQIDKSRILPSFLSRLVNDYGSIRKQIQSMSQGAIMSGLNSQIVKNIRIPLPSIEEQQKIVDVLSIADKRLEVERKQKAKLKRIKQGLMDLLLSGKVRVRVD